MITTRQAIGLEISGSARKIQFEDGSTIGAQAVILATGVEYQQLQVTGCWNNPDDPDGCNYVGAGVYYGASVSQAAECRDEDVYIVGGANSAGQAAMFMSKEAKSVTLLVRGPSLEASMSYYLIQQIENNPRSRSGPAPRWSTPAARTGTCRASGCRTGRPGCARGSTAGGCAASSGRARARNGSTASWHATTTVSS